jgi:hypothetical protein
MYAYQLFGIILRDSEELNELTNETRKRFENFPGLISRLVFSNVEDNIASGVYLCKDRETAERVKSVIHEIMENMDEYYHILHEFIFEIIDSTNYEWKCA